MRVRIGSGLILRVGPNGLDFYDRRLTVAPVIPFCCLFR